LGNAVDVASSLGEESRAALGQPAGSDDPALQYCNFSEVADVAPDGAHDGDPARH
jgi:hypothetical protein